MKDGSEKRFWFGRNWRGFVERNFNEERATIARNHILNFIRQSSLEGTDFLDIGCGSGLHSFAAHQSGARRIHSFDFDENSVVATRVLWEKAGKPANWTIEKGDVLDGAYIAKLGKWDFVYSWGVLHHTGEMWRAIRNAQGCVAEGGRLYIALYSKDAQPQADMWLRVKKDYVSSGWIRRRGWEVWYVWNYVLGRRIERMPDFFRRWSEHRKTRGMDMMTDIRDWLGGWPMEFAGDQETVDLLEGDCGFRLVNIATGEACSEFLFERSGPPPTRTDVKEFAERRKAERASNAPEAALA